MNVIFSLINQFDFLDDPRVLGRTKHKLVDILVLSAIACISNAETWNEIEDFGKGRKEWLKQFLELPNGIPSHDTIARVFSLVNTADFEKIFVEWVNNNRKKIKDDIICVDGKTLRGTVEKKEGSGRKKLSIVNAWSTRAGLVLGQKKSGSGYGEMNAALELIDMIEIKDCTIVGDAGIGNKSFINKVSDKGADYIFPIKKNSRKYYSEIEDAFSNIAQKDSKSKKVEVYSTSDKGHGRKESRYYSLIRKKDFPEGINKDGKEDRLRNLELIGRVVYESEEKETRPLKQEKIDTDGKVRYTSRENKVRKKKEVRYFVSSLKNESIEEIAQRLRLQWAIENKLHWVLDVSFGEDRNRVREKMAAANLALVRKIALNLAKQDETKKMSMRRKLKMASWDVEYLETLLFQNDLNIM